MDIDLESVSAQVGTATIDSTSGEIKKSSGELSGQNANIVCQYIVRILKESISCIGEQPIKRISVSFGSHSYVATLSQGLIFIVKVENP